MYIRPATNIIYIQGEIISTNSWIGIVLHIVHNGRNWKTKGGNVQHTWCLHADKTGGHILCEAYRSDGTTIVKNKPQKIREAYYMVQGRRGTIRHTKESAIWNASRRNDVLEEALQSSLLRRWVSKSARTIGAWQKHYQWQTMYNPLVRGRFRNIKLRGFGDQK